MSASDLSEHLVKAGRKLLAALDRAGLQAQGAAWIYFHHLGDWRYVVATPLVDTMGRSKVYKMLLTVMENIDVPEELTVDDIHLISTESPQYKAIGVVLVARGGGVIRLTNCSVNGMRIDAAVYRWGVRAPSRDEAKKIEKNFRQRVKELSG